jgi:hypothetical protein
MPNWCGNRLTITGPRQELTLFVLKWKAHHNNFRFSAFFPTPPDVDWYEWNVEHWGTKWDVDVEDARAEPREISMSFDTAWAPPEPFVLAVSEVFPGLTFGLEYEEPGADFQGYVIVRDGVVLEEESGPCPPEEPQESAPARPARPKLPETKSCRQRRPTPSRRRP